MRVLLCVWNQINLSIHRERERKGVRAWDLERKTEKKGNHPDERERERERAFLYVKSVVLFSVLMVD
jgi:hypothetical protein